ncbi:hypothetical protein WDZ16_12725 [Pseudokineococcus marinus]|uniref:Uncharacterized protein n=1 Tax=Pseudokineococcus marinus TaxID=351215 RepID=A0A849BN45_9ACTN|nr:hypothetical protein [Pseudokineococcus marinus]NNH24081.1 hypothetical protein [Pseudokineococcus marinus]
MARRRTDGGWGVPPSAMAQDELDRARGRVRMLNGALEGGMEGWTLPLQQWELVREVLLEVVDDADPERGALLGEVVETAQARLGRHPAFPGGRLTNMVRYVKVDLEGRGVLEVVPRSSPQRVRRGARDGAGGTGA